VTFTRDGTAVFTPVWFAEANERVYLRTIAKSGKVKRFGSDPRVPEAKKESTSHAAQRTSREDTYYD